MSHNQKTPDPLIAYTLPFILYVVPTMLETGNGMGLTYEFVCTLKGVLAICAYWWLRQAYPAWSPRGFGLAIALGVAGIVIWVLLSQIQSVIPEIPFVGSWLSAGKRAGFNPFANGGPTSGQAAFLAVRLVELILIVPLVEEIFWRGFLIRYLIDENFQAVPAGRFSWFSFVFVTLAFASVHPEFIAAVAWGALINLLYCKTGNVWACVVMHSVTNGLLALYVLVTGNWNLW